MDTFTALRFRSRFLAGLIAILFAWAGAAGHGAIYVRIANVPGDVKVPGYDNGAWFEALSGSYGVDRELPGSGQGGTEDINIGIGELKPIGLAHVLSRATAPLMQAAVNGNGVGTVEIHLVEDAPDGIGPPVIFGIIKLTNAFVFRFTSEGDSDDRPIYQAWFIYNKIEVTNRLRDPADPPNGRQFTVTWDLTRNTGTYTEGPVNVPPTLSSFDPATVPEDGTLTIPFTVTDPDGPAANLTVSAISSDQTLLPDSGLTVSGTGSSRSLTVQPAPDRHGATTVTVTVVDGAHRVSQPFVLTVTPVADPPRLAPIDPQVTPRGTPLTIPLTASDPDQATDALTLSATAANRTLLPAGAITFAHGTTGWSMTITPAAGESGSSDVTVTVTDATGTSAEVTFVLDVNGDPNSAPTDILLSPGTIPENSPADTLVGTLTAVDPDHDPNITFALSSDAGGWFVLVNGNEIRSTPLAALDYEAAASWSLMVRATDSEGAPFTKTLAVVVTNVNEAPVIGLDFPSSVPSSLPVSLPAAAVSFSDPDAGLGEVTVTLGVLRGTLRLDDSGALAGRVGGNETRTLTVTASLRDLLAVLTAGGLTYTSDPDYDGADSLTATIDDNGHSGDGPPLSATASDPFLVRAAPLVVWLNSVFTPDQRNDAEVGGLLGDVEPDGLSTLLEYKLNKNPFVADAGEDLELSEVDVDGQPHFQVSFIQRTDQSDPDTVLTVELATDLSGWSSDPDVLVVTSRTPLGGGLERVTIRAARSRTAEPAQFFRFRATYSGPIVGL